MTCTFDSVIYHDVLRNVLFSYFSYHDLQKVTFVNKNLYAIVKDVIRDEARSIKNRTKCSNQEPLFLITPANSIDQFIRELKYFDKNYLFSSSSDEDPEFPLQTRFYDQRMVSLLNDPSSAKELTKRILRYKGEESTNLDTTTELWRVDWIVNCLGSKKYQDFVDLVNSQKQFRAVTKNSRKHPKKIAQKVFKGLLEVGDWKRAFKAWKIYISPFNSPAKYYTAIADKIINQNAFIEAFDCGYVSSLHHNPNMRYNDCLNVFLDKLIESAPEKILQTILMTRRLRLLFLDAVKDADIAWTARLVDQATQAIQITKNPKDKKKLRSDIVHKLINTERYNLVDTKKRSFFTAFLEPGTD